jgi:hypothetical protein
LQARLTAGRSINPEMYEAYLKGMFHLNKFTPEGTKKGLTYLHQAIEKDPTDPLPYAGLESTLKSAIGQMLQSALYMTFADQL